VPILPVEGLGRTECERPGGAVTLPRKGLKTRGGLVANLRWLADRAPGHALTIEPLNPGDQPGYFLNDYDLAARVLDAGDRPHVGLQYDSYHAQVIHGDALAVWRQYRDRITHVQIGDAPGRTEPGRGSVDFAALFAAIRAGGYDGWISAEYTPTTARTEDSLRWMR
jgi:hydroxypyruvate isomerase